MKREEIKDKKTARLMFNMRGTIVHEILQGMPAWARLQVLAELYAKTLTDDVPPEERGVHVGRLLDALPAIEGLSKIDISVDEKDETKH